MLRRNALIATIAAVVLANLGSSAFAELPSGEPRDSAQRAYVQRYQDIWGKLDPDQREEVLEYYHRWRKMSPHQRHIAQRNLDELRASAADPERAWQFLLRTSMIASQRRAEAMTLAD